MTVEQVVYTKKGRLLTMEQSEENIFVLGVGQKITIKDHYGQKLATVVNEE